MVMAIKGDITKMAVDCIVNAANGSLMGGGGVDGAIHSAAGPGLMRECSSLGGCETGDAKITGAYNLPAKRVIHAVGPVYSPKDEEECARLLARCYERSLDLASAAGARSIAFPSISTGAYGYPVEKASRIAVKAIREWLGLHNEAIDVAICCMSDGTLNAYRREIEENASEV